MAAAGRNQELVGRFERGCQVLSDRERLLASQERVHYFANFLSTAK
jgi:hypothetical protein